LLAVSAFLLELHLVVVEQLSREQCYA